MYLNPNPFSVKLCSSDPCFPVIDKRSSTYNINWFGTSGARLINGVSYWLPTFNLRIPAQTPSVAGGETIPIYTAGNSDSLYSIECAKNACDSQTFGARLPDNAVGDNSGSDYLFDVVDTQTNTETGGFEWNTGCSSCTSGTLSPVAAGSPNPIWVAGASQSTNANCYARHVNKSCHGSSAAGTQYSEDEVDPVEWLNQDIPHKLHLAADCVAASSASVFPAAAGTHGSGPNGCPPMGETLWLDSTDTAIESLSIPRWAKTLYHNLHQYGWTVEDNGPGEVSPNNANVLYSVSDYTWTTQAQPSQWAPMLAEIQREGTHFLTETVGADFFGIPLAPSISVKNFHWLRQAQQ
jgi:hypothetical protein